jgi:hypothetical protein
VHTNAVSRALPVLTLLENGSPAIDKYVRRTGDKSRVGDHYFSDKAPLPTLLAVPFYRLVQASDWTKQTSEPVKNSRSIYGNL